MRDDIHKLKKIMDMWSIIATVMTGIFCGFTFFVHRNETTDMIFYLLLLLSILSCVKLAKSMFKYERKLYWDLD